MFETFMKARTPRQLDHALKKLFEHLTICHAQMGVFPFLP